MLAKVFGVLMGPACPLLVVVAMAPSIIGPYSACGGCIPMVVAIWVGSESFAKSCFDCPQKVASGSGDMAAGMPYCR